MATASRRKSEVIPSSKQLIILYLEFGAQEFTDQPTIDKAVNGAVDAIVDGNPLPDQYAYQVIASVNHNSFEHKIQCVYPPSHSPSGIKANLAPEIMEQILQLEVENNS